jgi:histidinol dehydrogenase
MRVLEGKAARRYVGEMVNRSATIDPKIERVARAIVDEVRSNGNRALRKYAEKFDGVSTRQSIKVSEREMKTALRTVPRTFLKALQAAEKNIRKFAEWQKPKAWMRTIQPGVRVGQKLSPLTDVGCYVPGGRYPLPSSLLMTVVPAQVAGVRYIAVASPNPARETLAAAALLGVTDFFRIGGAQAIAALAYGARPVLPVRKIVGPGNAYVTAAKKIVSSDCAIDMLAGPTEIVYVSDSGNPEFIASDLVAQAEHDPDTLPIFITSKPKLARDVAEAVEAAAAGNPIAAESVRSNGVALVLEEEMQAMRFANAIGPEHITLEKQNASLATNAGSIFIGPYSAQSLGDYVSGPNHVLPTGNVARYRGGLSVLDFLKIITVQEVSRSGLKRIGPTAITLAEAEGLKAHAESVRVRLR